MGGQRNELYYNSQDQTAATVHLSAACINPDSELQMHFNDNISVVAVQLSPELTSSNDSAENIVYVFDQQQGTKPVPSHDVQNSEEAETSRGHSDVMSSLQPEQEYCDDMINTYQVTQQSKASHFTRFEDFNAKTSEAFSVQESKDCEVQISEDCSASLASNMASNADSHDEFLISEEDKLEPRNDTVAAL